MTKDHTAHDLSFSPARVFIQFKQYLIGRLLEGGVNSKETTSLSHLYNRGRYNE